MIARGIAIALGAAILAATAHVTVLATGGYGTPHSFVTLAVAAGVAGGAVFSGMAWSAGRHRLAVFFVLCIVAGEAFGFLQTANRLIAGSEATQAPMRDQVEAHAKAVTRVTMAQAAVDKLPTRSPRLKRAEATKAAAEITAARAALASGKRAAQRELADARAALARMKPPASATPLADRTGIPQWVLDLIGAGLGSIAANGLACCLMIFGAHHHRGMAQGEIVASPPASDRQPPAVPTASRKPARRTSRTGRAPAAKDRAAEFARECLAPRGEADLEAIRARYSAWSARRGGEKRIPAAQVGRALSELLQETGITVEERDGRLVAVGISLKKPESRAIVPA